MLSPIVDFIKTPAGVILAPAIVLIILFALGDLIKWFIGGK